MFVFQKGTYTGISKLMNTIIIWFKKGSYWLEKIK